MSRDPKQKGVCWVDGQQGEKREFETRPVGGVRDTLKGHLSRAWHLCKDWLFLE